MNYDKQIQDNEPSWPHFIGLMRVGIIAAVVIWPVAFVRWLYHP